MGTQLRYTTLVSLKLHTDIHNNLIRKITVAYKHTPFSLCYTDDADTDSDVDSCTLDDDAHTDGRSLPDWPPSGRTSAKTVGTEDSNEDELGDTFNESSDAYK